MFSDFDAQTRQMLTGNLLMIGCCAFHLAWWLVAFRPEGAVKGLRSGWLLIPALLFGVAAVTQIVQGSGAVESSALLFPRNMVLTAAVVSMICYLLYYGLDKVKGYVDGMIPLLLVAVMMAVVTVGR